VPSIVSAPPASQSARSIAGTHASKSSALVATLLHWIPSAQRPAQAPTLPQISRHRPTACSPGSGARTTTRDQGPPLLPTAVPLRTHRCRKRPQAHALVQRSLSYRTLPAMHAVVPAAPTAEPTGTGTSQAHVHFCAWRRRVPPLSPTVSPPGPRSPALRRAARRAQRGSRGASRQEPPARMPAAQHSADAITRNRGHRGPWPA
jgi:hypothetical protein